MTFVSAFDETGDVRDDERLIIDADDAEVRYERSEGIVGNLRLRGADHGDQSRFPGIGQTDDADVGDQLELDEQIALLAGIAGLRESRGLPR